MSQIPSSIGRYEVMNPIGQGGMGSLFLAWDPKLERKIAIKLLRDDDESLRERFSREARSAARLRHPNIVTIFDVGDHEGQPFIAMEYIQGHTLAEMIHRRAAMPLAGKLELMEALCDGLGFAHKAGIIHRDVKPANLMVDTDGALKILDFGIARASESSGMTQAGMLIGTLNYMSPEQVSGATVDARSDIFAVGAVCYELLAYKQAFPGGLLAGILNRILMAQFEPIATVVPDLDPEAARIITKALAKDPADRYQDLQTMRKELLFLRMRLETLTGTEMAAPASDSPTIVVPTPVPVRRTSDREDLLRRRAEQIDGHLAEARQRFEAGDLEAAMMACEQALVLDADHHDANDLMERVRTAHDAAVRATQDAQQRAAAVRDLTSRAQAAYDRAAFAEAIELADQALAIERASAEAQAIRTRAVQGREAEARAAEEARAAAERRARAERIAAGVASARSQVASRNFGAAADALRALERAEGQAPEIAAALQEAAAGQREAERQARIAREAAAHVEAATDLLSRGELQQALARAAAALSVDAQHQAARALRTRIEDAIRADAERRRAEEAARRAEEAAAKQRQKASAAAIKQARKAKTPAAAIALLTDALRADPANPDLQQLLDARQAEQVQKQRQAAEQAAKPPQKTPTPGPDDRTVVLRPGMVPPAPAQTARTATPAAPAAVPAARKAPPPADGPFGLTRHHMMLAGGAAAAVLLILVSYFAFGGSDTPPAAVGQVADAGIATTPSSAPGQPDPGPPPIATPDPTVPETTAPPAEAVPPAEDPGAAEAAKATTVSRQIEAALRTARQQLQAGDRDSALTTAEGALRLRANDRDVTGFIGQIASEARTGAMSARSEAGAFGAHAASLPSFRDADARMADGDRLAGSRQLPDAARAFWQAEQLFAEAARDGRAAKEEADREAAAAKSKADAAAAAAATPPPTPDPPPPAGNPDETAIRALMQRYADAYTRSDARTVAAVYPALRAGPLQRGFEQLSSQRMELRDLRITIESATRASAQCTVVHQLRPRAGAENTQTIPATFLLEKRNGAWIIRERK